MTSGIIRVTSLIFASLTTLATSVSAGTINIDFLETGTGVTLSGSGEFEWRGQIPASEVFSNEGLLFVSPIIGEFGAGAVADAQAVLVESFTPSPFGTGLGAAATSSSGDVFGFAKCGNIPCIVLPAGYANGTRLEFSAEFADASFLTLGIDASNPISLTAGDNTINLNFSMAVIPLPPALPLLGAALLGFGMLGRRTQRRSGPRNMA